MRRCLGLLLLICGFASTAHAIRLHTQAELLLDAEMARPGETVTAAVRLQMAPHWHTYWRNPGESGGATKIKWTLPEGVTAGDIQWPVPEKYLFASLTTYVYHNEVVLLVPLTIANGRQPGLAPIKARISWLECEEQCVPGSAEVAANLEIGSDRKPSSSAPLISGAASRIPPSGEKLNPIAKWIGPAMEQSRNFSIEWKSSSSATNADFFHYGSKEFEISPNVEVLPSAQGTIRVQKTVKLLEGTWPAKLEGLVVENISAGQEATAHSVAISLGEGSDAARERTAMNSSTTIGSTRTVSVPLMLLYAFIGGLILNVMPCVLPVIALKIFGFVQQSKEDPRRVFRFGLIYALGVLASFAVFATMIVIVKKSGGDATWGMQMQFPHFRLAMTVLMVLVALNLFGVFEVTLGGRTAGAVGDLATKEGAAGAFFNGVLAVILATPCTAPFLATAVGFAIPQSPAIVFLFFLTVGLGLALPYVILSWKPAWLKFLPKPGAWMEKFKVALGFPILATAIWLYTLTGPSFGKEGMWGLGIFLLMLSLAVWVWGEFVQRGSRRKGFAIIIALTLLGVAYGYGLEDQMNWRSPVRKNTAVSSEEGGISWQPWSAAAIEKARSEGHPVLVDFTADWCLTCKANKKTSLEIASVRAKLKEIGAVALLADNTDPNPAIAAELHRFGRAGVPLVLVYPADPTASPIELPALLTPGIVLDALEKAAKR